MEFSLKEIADLLEGTVEGDENQRINSLGRIEKAGKGKIAFLANPKYEKYIYSSKATAVIVKNDFEPKEPINTNLIRVEDPYSSFTAILEEYQRLQSLVKKGKEKPARIGKKTSIGKDLYLGAFAYVGNNCKIGNNVKIHPQAFIGDNVTIGDNTIIFPGAKICTGTEIGTHCTIHPGAVIGSDGFGFAPQEDGSYVPIPQVGNVVIENHVSIGANATVDCATMGSTIIRSGVKIDNLVQVAHNVEIGEHTVIAAQAGVSGSAKIGKYCVVGGQAGITGHLTIHDKTGISGKAGIMSSTKKEGTKLMGMIAFDYKDCLRSYAVYKNLPEFQKRIEQLEEKIVNLPTN